MNPPAVAPPPGPSSTAKPGATKRARTATALSDVTNLIPDTRTPLKPRTTGHSDATVSTCSSSASVTPTPKRPSSSTAAAAVLEDECSVFKSPAISTVYARRGRGTTATTATTEAEATDRRRRRRISTAADKGKGPAVASPAAGTTTDKGKGKEPAVAAPAAGPTTDKGKGKGKEPAAGAATCLQLGKSTGIRNRKTSVAKGSSPAPVHEAKKKRRPMSSIFKLPEDFVKKQRAYFAEIDAFELPEEEVSGSDLD